MVTRRDLRAERDFYSPMTGDKSSTYGSQVKRRLEDIKNVKSTRTKPIEAVFAKLLKTADPFTQIEEKKSYAPKEENDFMGALEGAAGAAQDAIGEGVSKVQDVVRSTGQRASERRAAQQLKRQEERAADKAETDKKFATFGQAYRSDLSDFANTTGARFSDYESSIKNLRTDFTGSKAEQAKAMQDFKTGIRSEVALGDQDLRDKLLGIRKDVDSVKTRTYGGQGSSVNKLGATTIRQGGAVKDGKYIGSQERGPAVNVSGHYSDNREKQKNLRMAQAQQSRLSEAVKATGIPTGLGLKPGSFGISQAGRDQAAINKGIAAAVKTGIPNQTAVQGGAMSQAARDQAAINKGIKAAQATGIPSGDALKAGSFGISKAGAEQAAKNRAQAKAKAQAAKTSSVSTTTKQGKPRTAAQMSAAKRISSGKSISQSKAANRASMKANAAARNASFQAQKKAGTHSTASRTAAGQRARNKAAAKARAKAAAKRRRSKKKCDITIKYDISLLTNNNLRHDELADVAYFVRELQED